MSEMSKILLYKNNLLYKKNNINIETTREYFDSLDRKELFFISSKIRPFFHSGEFNGSYKLNKKNFIDLLLTVSPSVCMLIYERRLEGKIKQCILFSEESIKSNFIHLFFKVKINYMKDMAIRMFVSECASMCNSVLDFKKCILESKFSHITRQDYEKMKVLELKAMCKDKGLKRYSNKRKPELIDMLE